jgi:hypothetical protein
MIFSGIEQIKILRRPVVLEQHGLWDHNRRMHSK